MRDLVAKRGMKEQISVDSAGTANYHIGEMPHRGTRAKLEQYNISTAGMFARQLKRKDGDEYDYIVCMDSSNVRNALDIIGPEKKDKVIRLLDLTPHQMDVPDPWYTDNFQETYELCLEGCEALLTKILNDN